MNIHVFLIGTEKLLLILSHFLKAILLHRHHMAVTSLEAKFFSRALMAGDRIKARLRCTLLIYTPCPMSKHYSAYGQIQTILTLVVIACESNCEIQSLFHAKNILIIIEAI